MIIKLSDKKLITQFKHIVYALLLTILTIITLVLVVSCETEPKPADRKVFQPYMINRWLSMHPDYLPVVAECQRVIDNLSPEMVYKFYLDLLPKRKFFTKYISSKSEANQYTDKLFPVLSQEYGFSAVEFDLFMDYVEHNTTTINDFRSDLTQITGLTEKEVKKQFNV